MEKAKTGINVNIDVKATNFQNGNVFEGQGKLKTVFGGRDAMTEERLTFKGSDCGTSQLEANYNSTSTGDYEKNTEVELDLKGRLLKNGTIHDVIATNAKISKNDKGAEEIKNEDWLTLKIENKCDAQCATTESFYTNKTSEA